MEQIPAHFPLLSGIPLLQNLLSEILRAAISKARSRSASSEGQPKRWKSVEPFKLLLQARTAEPLVRTIRSRIIAEGAGRNCNVLVLLQAGLASPAIGVRYTNCRKMRIWPGPTKGAGDQEQLGKHRPRIPAIAWRARLS